MRIIEGKKLELIKKSLENYGAIFELPSDYKLVLINEEVFLVKTDVLTKVQNENLENNLISVGTQIGKFHKGNFLLGIEIHLIIGPKSKKVKLTEKGTSLFLYGRDVFVKNITNSPKKGFVIVSNKRDEIIGFGKFDGKMLINILDRGSYLRVLE
ncbi:MAG: hypothetical protein GYA60_04520 [Candidatus Methanofastidiosa archaeon]|nr:hypothetical protein [Candidatus Methanofastidiosa archaeon]